LYSWEAELLLLDDFEDLLQIKLGWDAFNSGKCLATVPLLNADMDV
jgi:hypothetical protein